MEDPINATSDYIQPYTATELLKLIDKAMRYANRSIKLASRNRSQNSALLHPAYTFFVTSHFEKGLKRLKKTYRVEAINTLRDAIIKLGVDGAINREPEDDSSEVKVKNLEIDDKTCRLLYGIIPDTNIISVSIEFNQ